MLDLKNICHSVIEICKEVGEFQLAEIEKINEGVVETKSLNSLVTYVDKKSEEKIVEALKMLPVNASFFTEEETEENTLSEFTWVIDPLDGTTNYIQSLPCYAISIALLENSQPILGVIYIPPTKECFHTIKDSPTFLNDKIIKVSKKTLLSDSLIATGFPYYDYGKIDNYMKLFKDLVQNARGMRRWGAAAIDLAYVAAGRYDGFYEYSLNAWDVAAGSLLVENAGGKISDFEGNNNHIFGKELVCGNPAIHSELLQKIKLNF
jgi:myo-inositol-1(or 4)-monophosphatase